MFGPRNQGNEAALGHGDEAVVVAGLKMEAAWGGLGLGVVVMPMGESGPRARRSS